jgi:hypothetical protein
MRYLVLISSWIFLLITIFIVGLEFLYFAKEGDLLNISVLDGLKMCSLKWAKDPTYWEGSHHILKKIPLWIVLLPITLGLRFYSKKINK